MPQATLSGLPDALRHNYTFNFPASENQSCNHAKFITRHHPTPPDRLFETEAFKYKEVLRHSLALKSQLSVPFEPVERASRFHWN